MIMLWTLKFDFPLRPSCEPTSENPDSLHPLFNRRSRAKGRPGGDVWTAAPLAVNRLFYSVGRPMLYRHDMFCIPKGHHCAMPKPMPWGQADALLTSPRHGLLHRELFSAPLVNLATVLLDNDASMWIFRLYDALEA